MSHADLFTTLRSSDHDFIAALRFIDDYAKQIYERGSSHQAYHRFVPRFDLDQHADTYELYGELPGFRREDIVIEANDSHNLQVSGSISPLKSQSLFSNESKGSKDVADLTTKPQDQNVPKETNGEPSGETSGEPSGGAPKPTEESTSHAKVHDHPPEALEATTTDQERYLNARFGDVLNPHPSLVPKKDASADTTNPAMIPQVRYLISERHPSEFHRAFHFPTPIKKDEITATMQDGILHISAKRAPAPPPVKVPVRDNLEVDDYTVTFPVMS